MQYSSSPPKHKIKVKCQRGKRMQTSLFTILSQTLRSYTIPALPQFLDILILSCQWAIGCNHCLEINETKFEEFLYRCFKEEGDKQSAKLQNLHLEQQMSNAGFQEVLSLLITTVKISFCKSDCFFRVKYQNILSNI